MQIVISLFLLNVKSVFFLIILENKAYAFVSENAVYSNISRILQTVRTNMQMLF